MKAVLSALLIVLLPVSMKALSDTDSLRLVLSTTEEDSEKLEVLLELTKITRFDEIKESFEYGNQLLELSRDQKNENMEVQALNELAVNFHQLGNFEKTIQYLYEAVKIVEDRGNIRDLAMLYNNMGLIYNEIGEYRRAISYYEQSLVYKNKLQDSVSLAQTLNNIGVSYMGDRQFELAKDHFLTALSIDENSGDSVGIYNAISNLGYYFFKKRAYDSAVSYYQKAYPLVMRIGSNYDQAKLHNDLGNTYYALQDYESALSQYQKGLEAGLPVNTKVTIKDSYSGISKSYEGLGRFQEALEYNDKFHQVRDSIFNEENVRIIANEQAIYELDQKEKEIELLRIQRENDELVLANNRVLNSSLVVGLVMILVLSIVLYQRNRSRTRVNFLLQRKNDEITTKNQNIVDSINYAKRIQDAIQPKQQLMYRFFDEFMVFCRARDIVNGDFYWFSVKDDLFVMAAVDCTGHGVPGAFMNVMGNSLLNQVVNSEGITNPAAILSELNKRVVYNLHQNDMTANSSDGMDMALCTFSKNEMKLYFAGAKRPLFLVRDGKLTVIKGDLYPIGSSYYQLNRKYTEHCIDLQPNDKVYIFSDGITDQFGGENNRKFMYKRFKDLLLDIEDFALDEQGKMIEQAVMGWKGDLEQTDDILVVGVKV